MSRAHMQKGASQQLTEKNWGVRRGRNGPRPVGRGRPAWPVLSPVHNAIWPRCSSVYFLYLRRPPHPSIHQRAADAKEKHWEEADDRHKSSNCLGDGLGRALAAMVGPTWWSHGGVLEPRLEFIKSFVPSAFDGNVIISYPTLIYIDEYFVHISS
jgi:hypothetical protein